jgi:hypothetical protein
MLIPTALSGPINGTVSLGGYLAGDANVENLQRALINLAQATQRPAINPGRVSGIVDDPTMTAVQAAVGLLSEELPTWAYLGLQAALATGATTSTAKNFVTQYAAQLTVAMNTAAVKFKVNAPQGGGMIPMGPQGFFVPGWYKTPAGMVLIGIAAFVIYKLFLQDRPATGAAK